MDKHDRMNEFAARLAAEARADTVLRELHPCYAGYFLCFNREQYYEAHDVLEHLWLQSTGSDRAFFKGLIQFAGGFVHLRLHYLCPEHRVHGRRLLPAARLFRLATMNISAAGCVYRGLSIRSVTEIAEGFADDIQLSHGKRNPWAPGRGPRILPNAQPQGEVDRHG